MNKAICSVSPIIYLYRVGGLDWLPKMFDKIWMPSVVLEDLLEGRFIGYDVPSPFDLSWVQYEDPQLTIPSAWVALDLSSGEVAAISLAFENRNCIVLMDEPMGRKAAQMVGIECWGTIKILLEAKKFGLTETVAPYVEKLGEAGIWLTDETRQRILKLAGEWEVEPEPEPEPEPMLQTEVTPPATSTDGEPKVDP